MMTVLQHPNQRIKFTFAWNANNQQAINLYKNGNLIGNRNSDGDSSAFDGGMNNTGRIIDWGLEGLFKFDRSGREPWLGSYGRESPNGNGVIIGFDDYTRHGQRDYDYDDALIHVTFSNS
jgi:hypothetical protein